MTCHKSAVWMHLPKSSDMRQSISADAAIQLLGGGNMQPRGTTVIWGAYMSVGLGIQHESAYEKPTIVLASQLYQQLLARALVPCTDPAVCSFAAVVHTDCRDCLQLQLGFAGCNVCSHAVAVLSKRRSCSPKRVSLKAAASFAFLARLQ
jgi:hypothetical protein